MAQKKTTTAVSKTNNRAPVSAAPSYTQDQIALITKTVAQGATQDELKLFLHQCQRTGLDPLSNQIYFIKRKSRNGNGYESKPTIQAGIDGLRLIANRTGEYAPGEPAEFRHDTNGKLISARIFIFKWVRDQWFKVWGEAYYDEYVQRAGNGQPTHIWREKPHIMLAKCAEAAALRRGFPSELSGLYAHDEIQQTDGPLPQQKTVQPQKQSSRDNEHKPEVVQTDKSDYSAEDPEIRCKNGLRRMGVPDSDVESAFRNYLDQAQGDVSTLLSWMLDWAKCGWHWNPATKALTQEKVV